MPNYSIELRGVMTGAVRWITVDAKNFAEAHSKAMSEADITHTVEAIDEIDSRHVDALQQELDELKCGHKVVKPFSRERAEKMIDAALYYIEHQEEIERNAGGLSVVS